MGRRFAIVVVVVASGSGWSALNYPTTEEPMNDAFTADHDVWSDSVGWGRISNDVMVPVNEQYGSGRFLADLGCTLIRQDCLTY